VRSLLNILALARGQWRRFLLIAVLVSAGTGAALFEPWIYRAIVDDIAGVFVPPAPVVRAERLAQEVAGNAERLLHSGHRIFKPPLRKHADKEHRRALAPRTAREATTTVLFGAFLLVLTRLVAEALRVGGDNRAAVLANGLERGFILRTYRHVLRLPLSFFTSRASGAIARQIDQSDQVAPVFTAVAQEIWPDLFTLVAVLSILFVVNVELATVALIAVPAYAVITWRMTRRLETELDEYYELWDEVSSRIQQTVAGIKTVKTHDTGPHEADQLEKAEERAYDSYLARNRLQNRYTYLQEVVVAVSKAAVVALGGIKALHHQLTPGDVVLFLSYLELLYQPIQGLTEMYTSLQQHVGSVRRAQKLLDTPAAPGEDLPPFVPRGGEVEFSDVRFGYDPRRPVLNGVSFRIAPGERVGIVGPSGAGKTTLTDLLVGLYTQQAGTIRVDSQALAEVSPSSLRGAVRGVAADGTLFRSTIRENIRYGRLAASGADVEEAAGLAGLGPLLDRLPDGLETTVGERGVELSVGERQRVLLARAFVARPTVLVLDEATANLDFRTEATVKEALERIARGRTSLIIAHRRSMLTEVDRVLVLRDGKIEQDGPPEVLRARPGYYRDMMTAQEGTL
jgi:ATP-binding cassette subfamily B protein